MMSQSQSTRKSLPFNQVIFVAALLVLGLLVSFLVVRFLDPSAPRGITGNHHQRSTADAKAGQA
jgi:uncharacterized membrane protein